jgi:hypothetical protein
MWLFPKNDGVFACGRVDDGLERGLLGDCGVVYMREKKVLRPECDFNEFWSIEAEGKAEVVRRCRDKWTRLDHVMGRRGTMTLLYSGSTHFSFTLPWVPLNSRRILITGLN